MWIAGFHSRIVGPLKGNRWQSTVGVRDWAIVINAADAAFRSASGQCSHFQKTSLNSQQIPAGLQNPLKSNFCFLTPRYLSVTESATPSWLRCRFSKTSPFILQAAITSTSSPTHLCIAGQGSDMCLCSRSGRKPGLF